MPEASTTEISQKQKPKGIQQNKVVAQKGGKVAKQARKELEQQTGESIISPKNAKHLQNEDKKKLK